MFCFKQKKYDKIIELIEQTDINRLKKKIKILIVDNEEFEIVDLLKYKGYDIYYKDNMTYPIEAEPFEIIILDIKGVGVKEMSSMEGFSVAKDVKKAYPHKWVCCYSGTTDPDITEQIKTIDDFIKKDTTLDKWSERLDNAIKKYCSKDYQWDVLNKKLIDLNVSREDINDMKSIYYSEKFDLANFYSLTLKCISDTDKALSVVKTFISIISVFMK